MADSNHYSLFSDWSGSPRVDPRPDRGQVEEKAESPSWRNPGRRLEPSVRDVLLFQWGKDR